MTRIKHFFSPSLGNWVSIPTLIVSPMLILAACASIPPPTEQLAVSKAAVESASRGGGAEFAPVELKSARDKLEGAEKAMAEEDYRRAKQLAEQAQVDAHLAEAKTDAAKTQKAADDVKRSNEVLREEVQRSTQQ